MKTKHLAMAALLSTASLFTACGDDVTKVTEIEKKTSGLETVASADSLVLPLCGGKTFDPDSDFCFKDIIIPLCNGERYNLDSSRCFGTKSGEKVYKFKDIWFLLPTDGDGYDVVIDERDGQAYFSAKIGEKYWMVENMNYETDDSYCYDDDSTNCAQYGRLYTWEAAKNACPEGWHLPSLSEWDALYDHVAQEVGSENGIMALKMASGWTGCEDGDGTNKSQFSALPAGVKFTTGFTGKGDSTFYWSSTPDSKDNNFAEIKNFSCEKSMDPGSDIMHISVPISVRCVRDL